MSELKIRMADYSPREFIEVLIRGSRAYDDVLVIFPSHAKYAKWYDEHFGNGGTTSGDWMGPT